MSNKKLNNSGSVIREYTEAILIALVLALFIRAFFVQAYKIPSGSMKETLLIGDHILVNKFIFGPRIPFTNARLFKVRKPERGEIIVFLEPHNEEKDFIKRVVGLPGETLEIKNRKVFIDGKQLNDDDYAVHMRPYPFPKLDNYGPLKIPEDSYFMMGDNRENSSDSRVWGPLPFKFVKGRAFLIYWSWDGLRKRVRWGRLGSIIH